jgi:hypothetical protein
MPDINNYTRLEINEYITAITEIEDALFLKHSIAVRMGTNADEKQFREYAESMTRETRREKDKIKSEQEDFLIKALLGNT